MAVVTERPVWEGSIRLIDPNDPVQGGAGGIDNIPHEQLANRTAYLKQEIEGIKGDSTEPVTLETLLQRIKDLETAPAITVPVLPIGATFETTVVYTSGQEVSAAMGYGTWQPFAEGRVTVGVSSKVDDPAWTKTIGTKHGEYEHTTTVEEMPAHNHVVLINSYRHGMDGSRATVAHFSDGDVSSTPPRLPDNHLTILDDSGGDQPHNNVQPSLVVGKWVRTA